MHSLATNAQAAAAAQAAAVAGLPTSQIGGGPPRSKFRFCIYNFSQSPKTQQ